MSSPISNNVPAAPVGTTKFVLEFRGDCLTNFKLCVRVNKGQPEVLGGEIPDDEWECVGPLPEIVKLLAKRGEKPKKRAPAV
jgi:hypothetical protein